MAYSVLSYETAEVLDGTPSEELVAESLAEKYGTGAVPAYRDADGVWQYLHPSQESLARDHWGVDPVTVYVEG